jgi:hypothetical protein
MDLIDRYLYAVRRWLPADQQDDVIRELSDDLRSQVEDQEATLGRPLDTAEQTAIVRRWGHPLLLAARYLPQRQLIGPCVFPIYWLVLRLSVSVAVVVHVAAALLPLVSGRPPDEVIRTFVAIPFGPLMMVFAWVTFVFALIDRYVPRLPFLAGWKPESLPPVPADPRMPSTAQLVAEIVATMAGALWVAAVPQHQWLLFGPGTALIELGPGALRFHLPILFLIVANLVVMWTALVRPSATAWRRKVRIATDIASLVLIGLMLGAGDPLIVGRAGDASGTERLAELMNTLLRIGLVIAVVAIIGRELLRLFNRARVPGSWSPRQG